MDYAFLSSGWGDVGSTGHVFSLNLLAANIYQVAVRTKPQANQLLIEGVKFAEGRDVQHSATKYDNIALKRTLSRNQPIEEIGQAAIANFQMIQMMAKGR
jgi:hypothetical protein